MLEYNTYVKAAFSVFNKRLWIVVLLFTIQVPLGVNAQHYNQTVYLPAQPVAKEVVASVNDMAYWLEQATGKHFDIKTSETRKSNGIQLQWVDQSNLPTAIKKQILADGQTFYLTIDGTNNAQIVGSGTNSFINGIYTFLQELGFRWYMPGDTWTIVPKLSRSTIKLAKVYSPDFENRSYFGTGGINPVAELDPQNTFASDFYTWNRRNRLSSDYVMKGHMGQAFYNANKKVLNEHPEYFCGSKVNPYGRIDIGNTDAVKFYVQWAISQVNPQARFSVIGVDPADGSGGKDDCLPANMPQIKTWSDKYFWLANRVAQQAEKQNINAPVELYAYASHAAPPSFALQKNVYPVIIPYAFQDIAEPDQYIELWSQKMNGRPMGMYDYWNITQWSSDVPQFNIYSIPDKLRFWKKNNITTINLESTNAKGPMGHAFWLATQMMWNTNLSLDSLYNAFLNDCFGPAASDIKNMYDRWSRNYQGAMDVSLSLQDLAAASAKTSNPAIQKRISELKAYVHYLKLYYDYQDKPSPAGYKELINYIYSIHDLRLLQTSALVTRYIKAPKGFTESINKKVAALENPQIEKSFKTDRAENPVAYTISDFRFDITKAYPVESKGKKRYNPLYINGTNNYSFYLPEKQSLTIQAGATADTRLTIKDDKGKVWYDKVIAGSKEGYQTVKVDLPKGNYVLTFGAYYRWSRIIFPDNIAFFSSGKFYDNYGYPLLYVYVPKDVTEIVYNDAHGPGLNNRGDWIDPAGKHIKPELIKYDTYRVPVPPQYRGKVWILNIGHSSFNLLNIPDLYSLNPFGYKD